MAAERWAGEQQLKDNIDSALRSYVEAWKVAAREPDADEEIFGDWEDHDDIMVGWIIGIQTLGRDEEKGCDADGIIDLISDGMSQYSALGITTVMQNWLSQT